ncbi:MAG TPA: aspartate-semialdehyde dehydrogenase [Gammaproteobacteria bacterium]|nr:aspartate-semialdehyde dehydrogenase [Gammaproteobacteria bacterium]
MTNKLTKKSEKAFDLAVVGATGLVGEAILEILQERKFPCNKVYAVASHRSAGDTVLFGKKNLEVLDLASFDFSKVQLAFFSAGGSVSEKYVPKAAQAGCVVIDNTAQFRYEPDVPLVIPEINGAQIAQFKKRNIIANPNCSTIQMLVALKPIYDAVGIKKITVATYQSVSGTGRAAVSELIMQTGVLLNGQSAAPQVYPQTIAFNVLPHIDVFMENGFTKEEMKMIWETHKILGDDKIIINPTTVRVPVVYGHSEAITVETTRSLTADQARELLAGAPGIKVVDNPQRKSYPTPLKDVVGKDAVFVGRIRNGVNDDHTLNLWVVADNIRKGAALNAVQIAEILTDKYF